MIVLVLTLLSYVAPLLRETNSHAATQRGRELFEQEQYEAAAKSFADADAIVKTPESAFNLGTAQIAAGQHSAGSATLEPAMRYRTFAADAFYNRGNSALAAGAFEYAIRDFTDALKMRPGDPRAQRNLEIALHKKNEMMQRTGASGRQQQQQPSPNQQRQPSTGGKQQEEQPQGKADLESLLRSVQQQEQEERQRMKQAGQLRERIGW